MRRWHRRSSARDPRARWLAALCGPWALLWALAVRASEPATVLLLRVDDDEADRRWRAGEGRTRDELRAMGLDVVELQTGDPDRREGEVERWMAERGATAAVRLERGPEAGEAKIWLLGPRPRGGRLQTIELAGLDLDGGEAATLAGLRAVEAVHTGLLELAAAAPRRPAALATAALADTSLIPPAPVAAYTPIVVTRPRAAPDEPARPLAAPRVPVDRGARRRLAGRHALGVHATVGGGPGGLGVLTGLELAYRRELPRVFAVQVDALASVTPGWRAQGDGSIVMGLAGARVQAVVQPRQQRVVTPRLGLGGGAALVWAVGRAPSPLRGVRDVEAVAVVTASASLAVRVRPRLRVVVGLGLDVLLPPIVVRIAGDETSRLGLPTLRGALGLEWSWPAAGSRPRPRTP